MKRSKISDSELMAEKLGIITLCHNCGERIEVVPEELEGLLREILRSQIGSFHIDRKQTLWMHTKTTAMRCDTENPIPFAEPREQHEQIA